MAQTRARRVSQELGGFIRRWGGLCVARDADHHLLVSAGRTVRVYPIVLSLSTVVVSTLLLVLGTSMPAAQVSPLSPEEDFQARCSAPGVTLCNGFDTPATDITPHVQPGASGIRPQQDTSQKTSGVGSLRSRIPNVPPGSANMAGAFDQSMGAQFGQNSTFYVQYRFRASPEMISNMSTWSPGGWKMSNFHGNQPFFDTCANVELTITQTNFIDDGLRYIPQMYSECGARGLWTNSSFQWTSGGTGTRTQQSPVAGNGFNCTYPTFGPQGSGNGSGCFYLQPNIWYTFDFQFQLGSWGSPNSVMRAWVTPQGSTTRQQWLYVSNFTINFDNGPTDGWNSAWLGNYMTGNTQVASTNADTWYDELIVSRQPIALPGAGANPAPQPPMSVTVR